MRTRSWFFNYIVAVGTFNHILAVFAIIWLKAQIRMIKGRSSRLLRQEFPWLKSRLPTLWTNAYFVSTVGGAPLEVVKQYIENQKRV
jgi:REP element-mobilizing transposase RayT